jgi:LuxR family transcriptional regulator, regulator of acetate metabolism
VSAVHPQEVQWCEGPILEDRVLAGEVARLWAAACDLLGVDGGGQPPRSVTEAGVLLRDAAAEVSGVLSDADERRRIAAASLVPELYELVADLREEAVQTRVRAFARAQAALARLRSVGDVGQMMRLVVTELCTIGFDRAMFSRVSGGLVHVEAVHVVGDAELAGQVLSAGRRQPIVLDHELVESEMVRRRAPILVTDAQGDSRVHAGLLAAAQNRCYVAAPVMPEGEVIGFLHADCQVQRRIVDEFDRDLLWTFAEGFSAAYDRTLLLERLGALRQEIRRANHSILAVMDEFCDAEVEIARIDRENHSVAHSAAAIFVNQDSRLEQLLTRRELDVIKLMAAGETNAGIAKKLVVSEGTVKSHVKHILRKLRASNRAEAVSRFVKLSQQAARPQD